MNSYEANVLLSGIATATVLVPVVSTNPDKRIVGALSYISLLSGLGLHGWLLGWQGVFLAATGACIAGGLFLVMFQLGWLQAEDVKLITAVGALLTIHRIVPVISLTALAGAITLLVQLLSKFAFGKVKIIPYRTSIAAGTILTVMMNQP